MLGSIFLVSSLQHKKKIDCYHAHVTRFPTRTLSTWLLSFYLAILPSIHFDLVVYVVVDAVVIQIYRFVFS